MKRDRPAEIHFYEWPVSGWRVSEARRLLDGIGRNIYRELLDLCYTQGGFTDPSTDPAYMAAYARDCAVTLEQFEASWPAVRKHFLVSKDDSTYLIDARAELVRREYFGYVKLQSERRKAAWEKRSDQQPPVESTDGNASLKHVIDSNHASLKHVIDSNLPKNKTKVKNNGNGNGNVTTTASIKDLSPNPPLADASQPEVAPIITERDRWFHEKFWPSVWTKTAKADALESWRKIVKTEEQMSRIVDAAIAQGPVILQRAALNKSTPIMPATWLNHHRYEDEQTELPLAKPVTPQTNKPASIWERITK